MTITTTERDLGDGRLLVTSTDVEEERSSQAIHQTCADGARLIRCVYDGDLDRIALLDGIERPESDIQRLSTIPQGEGPWARHLREARLLVALRIDRKAPAAMIRTAQAGLEGIEQMITAANEHGVQDPAPEPAAPDLAQVVAQLAQTPAGRMMTRAVVNQGVRMAFRAFR